MTEICCENCLDEFEIESDSSDAVICPYCRNWTRIDFNDLEELEHNKE